MRIIFAVLFLFGLALPAAAKTDLTDEQIAAIQSNCGSDMENYCEAHLSGNTSTQSAMEACMKRNFRDLSPKCQRTLIRTRTRNN